MQRTDSCVPSFWGKSSWSKFKSEDIGFCGFLCLTKFELILGFWPASISYLWMALLVRRASFTTKAMLFWMWTLWRRVVPSPTFSFLPSAILSRAEQVIMLVLVRRLGEVKWGHREWVRVPLPSLCTWALKWWKHELLQTCWSSVAPPRDLPGVELSGFFCSPFPRGLVDAQFQHLAHFCEFVVFGLAPPTDPASCEGGTTLPSWLYPQGLVQGKTLIHFCEMNEWNLSWEHFF